MCTRYTSWQKSRPEACDPLEKEYEENKDRIDDLKKANKRDKRELEKEYDL